MSTAGKRTLAIVGPVFVLIAVIGACGGKAEEPVPAAIATIAQSLST